MPSKNNHQKKEVSKISRSEGKANPITTKVQDVDYPQALTYLLAKE